MLSEVEQLKENVERLCLDCAFGFFADPSIGSACLKDTGFYCEIKERAVWKYDYGCRFHLTAKEDRDLENRANYIKSTREQMIKGKF